MKKGDKIKMLCSIIVLVWNQLEYTKECFQTIEQYTDYPFELVVVDNGSTDGTAEYLKNLTFQNKNFQCLKVITNPENYGASRGWNQGLREAKGECLCIINNDVLFTPGWLGKLISHLGQHPEAVAVSAHIIDGQLDTDFQEYAGRYMKENEHVMIHMAVLLTCCVIRRKAFEKVGYFDEQFEMATYEDADYMWRMTKCGYRLDVIHKVVIYHYGMVSRKHLPPHYEKENLEKYKKKYCRTNKK